MYPSLNPARQEKGVDFSKFDFIVTDDPRKNHAIDLFQVSAPPPPPSRQRSVFEVTDNLLKSSRAQELKSSRAQEQCHWRVRSLFIVSHPSLSPLSPSKKLLPVLGLVLKQILAMYSLHVDEGAAAAAPECR